ncbi:MAG: sulfatase-like hydrolase/transferase [Planctomycetaceae bacterium]
MLPRLGQTSSEFRTHQFSRATILITCILTMLMLTSGLSAAENQRPNILVILADDMGSGDLGCYNSRSKVPTPNLDQLAKSGMRFTDAHSPSAVCTPTRYGLLTGRYAWRTRLKRGVLWGYSPALIKRDRMTIASLLKANGYHTGCVGKWHLGLGNAKKTDYTKPLHPCPNDHGFDYFFGIPASLDMDPYVYVENDKVLAHPTLTIKGSGQVRRGGKGFWRGGPIAPGFRHIDVLPKITEKATAFLERHAKSHQDKPFFLYVPFSAPHTPWLPTKKYRGKSGAGTYGDFAHQVDDSVGDLLKTLDRLKFSENTLVIFTSDNGAHWTPGDIAKFGHRANWHLRGQKADAWEGGHRIPFLVRWPGHIKPGGVSNETICLTDVFATVAEVVGTALPDNAAEDSFSILPVLKGAFLKKPIRPATVHHSVSGMFAIRKGNWKLILGRGSGGFSKPRTIKPKPGEPDGQLYNLERDPSETDNVYLKHPEVVEELSALLKRYQTSGRSRPKQGR